MSKETDGAVNYRHALQQLKRAATDIEEARLAIDSRHEERQAELEAAVEAHGHAVESLQAEHSAAVAELGAELERSRERLTEQRERVTEVQRIADLAGAEYQRDLDRVRDLHKEALQAADQRRLDEVRIATEKATAAGEKRLAAAVEKADKRITDLQAELATANQRIVSAEQRLSEAARLLA